MCLTTSWTDARCAVTYADVARTLIATSCLVSLSLATRLVNLQHYEHDALDWIPYRENSQRFYHWKRSDTLLHNDIFKNNTPFNGPFPGLSGWAGTRKVKPIWILLKQETVSGSGISWAICKSAPGSRQITTPATNHSVFYRPDALPAAQPTVSKHWRQSIMIITERKIKQISNRTIVMWQEVASPRPFPPRIWTLIEYKVPLARTSPHPKVHLDRLIRFARAHQCVQRTDRPCLISSNRPQG